LRVAEELSAFLPKVAYLQGESNPRQDWVAQAASRIAASVHRDQPDYLVIGATRDGRDLAGMLAGLLGWGVLTNARQVDWSENGPVAEMDAFGGRFVTRSSLRAQHGIITVRPNSISPEVAGITGTIEPRDAVESVAISPVNVVERHQTTGAGVTRLEEAHTIVAGGRGLAGPDGFGLVRELAELLGGAAIAATKPPVDEGWVPYELQIGQTGKVVRPDLYVALGISGAIQHRVGMQTAKTIVAITIDDAAPFSAFADMLIVGDLFEVVPEVIAQLKARI
jgi:electron transfer flavoprotein alpha subunit